MGISFGCNLGDLIPFFCTPSCIPVRSNINDLRNDLRDLVAKKNDLQRRIDASPGMRPLEQVNEWLSQTERLEADAQQLIDDYTQNSTNNYFWGLCPKNCRTRCDLWMRIPPMDNEVTDLEQRLPPVVFEEAPIPSLQSLPTEETTGMKSMIAEVWSHVQDENTGMIGLHGMGGVGKTTLLKEVFNKLCASANIFDLQLYIVVSKTPNLEDIQNDIGKKIGLRDDEWKSKKLDQKAIDIFNILEKKKYVMFLDDIWDQIELLDIGIPHPNLTNKSKVIFTTRLVQVCGEMKADKQIKVKCLNEAEAWALFKKNVGEEALNAHPDIPDHAKDVMKECGCLPLALIVVGRAMSSKTTIDEWKHAIDALKENAAMLSKKIPDKVFAPLKYSYDNFSDVSIRSCFLYCSLYPEGAFISKEDLIDKWLCEDFLVQSNDLGKERRQGYVNIGILVKANLLEEFPNEVVKMHDIIRDMAIWIGGDCGENQDKFIVKARAGLTQMPYVANWELTERMSLMYNNIIDEPNAKCPNLMTLLLVHCKLRSIKNGFFEFMTKLRVLDLSYNEDLRSLPKDIGKLVCLQYLDVSFTNVVELPKELKELRKLKVLNLQNTHISSIPEGVVSSLKELRVFKFRYIFRHDHLYKEVESLKYLNDVTSEIRTKDGMSRLSSSINMGDCITYLTIEDLDDLICLDLVFLRNIKYLDIRGVKTLEKIEVGRHGMILNSLRCLVIGNCDKLKDISWLEFAPNIEVIFVSYCREMKTLVGEPGRNDNTSPFAKLEILHLIELMNLESIYHTNLELPCLKDLWIRKCNKLEKIPFQYVTGCRIQIEGEKSWWDNLKWEDDATRISFSSHFEVIA